MMAAQPIWLVVNDASGSNDRDAIAKVKRCCQDNGLAIDRIVSFPAQPLPNAAWLEQAGIGMVAVFTGDGTANAVIRALAGWDGAVLVLPGGTMNLLYHRLHGDRVMEEVIPLAAAGEAERVRPGVIRCTAGTALADLLAGPGTSWHDVREAMRQADLAGAAAHAAHALGATFRAPGITCREPDCGEPRDYPLIMLTPTDQGIHVSGFRAASPGEYLEESWAVLRRRFREGPHDDLGSTQQVTLASSTGEPFAILLDGEAAECPAEAVFTLVPCAVDLLATETDGL